MDVHDSEINEIHKILQILRKRAAISHSYQSFQDEIIDRFARIGFVVDVRWYETDQADVKMPEINISGRTDPDYVFDRDKQTHEVTSDLLDIGGGGVIKVDKGMAAALENGSYRGQAGHQH
jgi:hypothetical protein